MIKRVMEEKDRVNKERRRTMRIKNVIVILSRCHRNRFLRGKDRK